MSWDRIEGSWKQVRGKIREQWGKLTDDDLDVIAGRRDMLLGKLQEKYGIAQEEADRQVRDFQARYEGAYWNTTGIGRHVIVAGLLPELRKRNIKVFSHGATGFTSDSTLPLHLDTSLCGTAAPNNSELA